MLETKNNNKTVRQLEDYLDELKFVNSDPDDVTDEITGAGECSKYTEFREALSRFSTEQVRDLIHDIYNNKGMLSLEQAIKQFIKAVDTDEDGIDCEDIMKYEGLVRDDDDIRAENPDDVFNGDVIKTIFDDNNCDAPDEITDATEDSSDAEEVSDGNEEEVSDDPDDVTDEITDAPKGSKYHELGEALKKFSTEQVRDLIHDIYNNKGTLSLEEAIEQFIKAVGKDEDGIDYDDIMKYEGLVRDDDDIRAENPDDVFNGDVIKSILGTSGSSSDDDEDEEEVSGGGGGDGNEEEEVSGDDDGYKVDRGEKSKWHKTKLNDKNVEFQYESLERPFKGDVSTGDADYIMVIKSGGKEHRTITEDHFGVTGGDVVGYAGSKDKAVMLVNVRDLDNINIDTGDSSVQIIRIKTDEDLTVLGGSAIDDELVKGSNTDNDDDDTTVWKNGEAVNKENIEHRRVESPYGYDDGAFFTIYADDETKEGTSRTNKLIRSSQTYWGGGDDTAYLLEPGQTADPTGGGGSGNGAILHIGIA
jgi:hypothetical protein